MGCGAISSNSVYADPHQLKYKLKHKISEVNSSELWLCESIKDRKQYFMRIYSHIKVHEANKASFERFQQEISRLQSIYREAQLSDSRSCKSARMARLIEATLIRRKRKIKEGESSELVYLAVVLENLFETTHQASSLSEFCHGKMPLSIFDEGRVAKYSRQILQAIELLRENGSISCNLNPENTFLSKNGEQMVITEYYNAYEYFEVEESNFSTDPFEELAYMAPENLKSYSEKQKLIFFSESDVWRVGCIVVELLTCKKPWFTITVDKSQIYNLLTASGDSANYSLSEGLINYSFLQHSGRLIPASRRTLESLSYHCRAFLESIFTYNKAQRPSIQDLKGYPFLNKECKSEFSLPLLNAASEKILESKDQDQIEQIDIHQLGLNDCPQDVSQRNDTLQYSAKSIKVSVKQLNLSQEKNRGLSLELSTKDKQRNKNSKKPKGERKPIKGQLTINTQQSTQDFEAENFPSENGMPLTTTKNRSLRVNHRLRTEENAISQSKELRDLYKIKQPSEIFNRYGSRLGRSELENEQSVGTSEIESNCTLQNQSQKNFRISKSKGKLRKNGQSMKQNLRLETEPTLIDRAQIRNRSMNRNYFDEELRTPQATVSSKDVIERSLQMEKVVDQIKAEGGKYFKKPLKLLKRHQAIIKRQRTDSFQGDLEESQSKVFTNSSTDRHMEDQLNPFAKKRGPEELKIETQLSVAEKKRLNEQQKMIADFRRKERERWENELRQGLSLIYRQA